MAKTANNSHFLLPAIGIIACFLAVPGMVHAQDTDENLVPGDSNDYVVLSELLTGQVPSVTVGDKKFSLFQYVPAGDMPAAADISVFGFQDGDGNYGLSLHGVFWDLGTDAMSSSATLEYEVDVNNEGQEPPKVISDAHLFLGGPGTGLQSDVSVEESFAQAMETLHVYSSTTVQPPEVLSDWVDFSQTYPSLQVTALISAFSASPSQPARASIIDLSYSQTEVPEPSSALLVLLAGASAAIFRSRRSLTG